MKLTTSTLGVLLVVAAGSLLAQAPHADPLAENLFPPDLIMKFQSEIGLTEEQRSAVKAEMEMVQPRFEKLHRELRRETAALAELLKKERVEEVAALARFDAVLGLERDIKRAHLALVIALKNKLSPEQQAKLRDLRREFGAVAAAGPPGAIPSKMERVKDGVASDPEALRAHIQGLVAAPDVPWRQIAWKSCLLDGLKESREKKKPLVLWVFIDRPTGDRRC